MSPAPALTSTSCVRRVPSLLGAEVDGETVLLNVDRGHYYGLDDIAGDIWGRLEQARPIAELCSELSRDYQAEPAQVEEDVLELLRGFLAEGMIEVVA